MNKVTLEELKKAYSKYKTFIYYDNSELFQREQLAEYETDEVESKLKKLVKDINGFTDESEIGKFGKIEMHYLPKSFKEKEDKRASNFITNQRVENEYDVEKIIAMADVSVEWHLITVLWLMRYGYLLDEMLGDECMGNRLHLNKETKEIKGGGSLYKPYFKQYQQWRDNAVEIAQNRLNRDKNMAVVNLDIKDFFYSAAITFESVENDICEQLEKLRTGSSNNLDMCKVHVLFKRLHDIYSENLRKKKYPYKYPNGYDDKCVLPIGLASSYVLANHYLMNFDNNVKNLVPNVYYGRYVDDILIVIEDPDINFHEAVECKEVKKEAEKSLSKGEKFIAEWFERVLEVKTKPDYIINAENKSDKSEDIEVFFQLKCYDFCYIQPSKTLVYYFDKEETTAAIDKLKYDLDVRASEFRDFPIEGEDLSTFDDSAYHLIFDDSEGKIRTLKDYKENRLGLSVFLANRIFAALRRTEKTDESECKRVVKMFRGITALTYFRMWEKVFTFLVINNQHKLFEEFWKHTRGEIEKLELKKNNKNNALNSGISNAHVATSLIKYLNIAVQMALSLNIDFIKSDKIAKNIAIQITNGIIDFRSTYFVRHNYTVHPLVTLVDIAKMPANLTSNSMSHLNEGCEIIIPTKGSSYKVPRKVKFWECCIAQVNEAIIKIDCDTKGKCDMRNIEGVNMLDSAFEKYSEINKLYFSDADKIKKQFYSHTEKSIGFCGVDISEFKIGDGKKPKYKKQNPQIAIANTRVWNENIISSVQGSTKIDTSRYNTLAKILKETRHSKSDVLIMPECSVPVTLLPSLARYSADNDITIVTGLEHWNVNNVVFNFIVTITPVQVQYAKDAVILYRLKNHYAPDEQVLIEGYGYHVPARPPHKYYITNWQGIYFASFYCFELANALHRSLFKGKIDLMIISELNRDIPYYDNIIGATTRDLHCYIAQVNTSEYGDSRLTQPTITATRNILKLKGGLNDTILTERIDIKSLREFQLMSYELSASKGDKSFKPLPPDWERGLVEQRKSGGFVIEELKGE